MKDKIQSLISQLNHGLVQREQTLKAALLTVLAGENIVLIGPPGTGKSLIARRIADCFEYNSNNSCFEYLLTKFSTPEEIFGPLSISELKADRFRRNTYGYLPTVKIAFLDEIFKASSSILNSLLTILNERIYHNGSDPQKVPLQALIAASNELPTNQSELSALYDRFLVRSFVDYVSEQNFLSLFNKAGESTDIHEPIKITEADLKSLKVEINKVSIPSEVAGIIQRIWWNHKEIFKEDSREALSDRRLIKVLKLLRVSAFTNGRNMVDFSDVMLLKDCLWNSQENSKKVLDCITKELKLYSITASTSDNKESRHTPSEDPIKRILKASLFINKLKGSGTKSNPFLIETVDDFFCLNSSDYALKEYYFLQIKDVDLTNIKQWKKRSFKGHYDGGGFTIKGSLEKNEYQILFKDVQSESSIKNIELVDIHLCEKAIYSEINCCSAIKQALIFESANNCKILNCESKIITYKANCCDIRNCKTTSYLIEGDIEGCDISVCESGNTLIYGDASRCRISNCLIMIGDGLDGGTQDFNYLGGVAISLIDNSCVERCFVSTKENKNRNFSNEKILFSGIADSLSSSTIQYCALGNFDAGKNVKLKQRIVGGNNGTLVKNISIDGNSGRDGFNGKDGKTVNKSEFNQRFFEEVLGWDFMSVWQWNSRSFSPSLQLVGHTSAKTLETVRSEIETREDELTRQIRDNIWL